MLDSESRWRLVRKLKRQAPKQVSEIEVRAAEVTDMGLVADIYNYYVRNSVVTFDKDPISIPQWIDKLNHLEKLKLPFLVLLSEHGEVIGFAYVAPWREKAAYRRTVENSVYLRPAISGRGLGRMLMERLLEESRNAGVREVVAVISDSGAEASIALHLKLGFTKQGHLGKVGYKFGRWLGTELLQKSLKE